MAILTIPGERVKQILRKYGFAPNPGEAYVSHFEVESDDTHVWLDVNSRAVRSGENQDRVPLYPVRIFFNKLRGTMGTVSLEATNARELNADDRPVSKALGRQKWEDEISPWKAR